MAASFNSSLIEQTTEVVGALAGRLVVVSVLLLGCSRAWAGPPLSIDDPGILDFGQFELNAALTLTSVNNAKFHELPLLDLSLGLVEDYVQASAGFSHVYWVPGAGTAESGLGNPEVGVKLRFVNRGRLQLAIAPTYVFGVDLNSAEKGIGHSENIAVLPISAEYQVSDAWRLNGELAYIRPEDGQKEWGYGVAVAWLVNERQELLLEMSGVGGSVLASDFMQARVGTDYALTDSFHLLLSVGTGLREPTGEDIFDFDLFIGIRILR